MTAVSFHVIEVAIMSLVSDWIYQNFGLREDAFQATQFY
jgi:hypothetical protein